LDQHEPERRAQQDEYGHDVLGDLGGTGNEAIGAVTITRVLVREADRSVGRSPDGVLGPRRQACTGDERPRVRCAGLPGLGALVVGPMACAARVVIASASAVIGSGLIRVPGQDFVRCVARLVDGIRGSANRVS
jgi:hypothetical protein